jgi:tetratricopeptide (TPR) repeat protein
VAAPRSPSLDYLEPDEKERLRAGLYEVLLILADAVARPLPGQAPQQQGQQAAAALRVLERAAELGPPTPALYRRRARCLTVLGDREGAAQAARQAEALCPVRGLDWFLAGYDRWFAGDVSGAMADFDRALQEQPDLFWARFFRALGYQKLRNVVAARDALTVCIKERPDFVWLYLLRGFLHGRSGNFALAEDDFRKAAALKPDALARYVIRVNRGVLALQRGQTVRAIGEFREAIGLQPQLYHAHVNLAQAYGRQMDLKRALAEMAEAIRLERRRAELYRTRARFHLRAGDRAAALRDLEEAIRLAPRPSPEMASDQVERGLILYQQGKYAEALAACAAALAARDHPPAHRLRAESLLKLGRYPEAVAEFDRYLKGGRPEAEVFRKSALARAELGDYPGVIGDYTRALALAPDAGLHAARGWAYLVNEAPKPALQDFDEALRRDPDSGEAYSGRAFARVKLGLYREGVADAREALRLGPPTPRLLYNAARTFAQAGAAAAADPRLGSRLGPQTRAAYQDEALRLLRGALERLPAKERSDFWRRHVRKDGALRPIRRASQFSRLAAVYGGLPK